MTDFATLKTELGRYAHSQGDSTVIGRCIVQALRHLRGQRADWAEGKLSFVCESGVAEYPFGSYPRLPGGVLAFSNTPHSSYTALSGAVINPSTLVSSAFFSGGTVEELQGSAERPGDTWLDSTSSGTGANFVVSFDAVPRALKPGKFQGSGAQVFRVAAYHEGTNRSVSWAATEDGNTVGSGSFEINSTNASVYEMKWDAAKLSTLTPEAGDITLTLSLATGDGTHFTGLQWFTYTDDESNTVTGGSRELIQMGVQEFEELTGGRVEVLEACPSYYAMFNDKLLLYPTPNGAYRIHGWYQVDSTRDETTGAKITESSTTETNEWFRDGYVELTARALEIYHGLRTHDAKAMQMSRVAADDSAKARSLAYEQTIFSGPPRPHF